MDEQRSQLVGIDATTLATGFAAAVVAHEVAKIAGGAFEKLVKSPTPKTGILITGATYLGTAASVAMLGHRLVKRQTPESPAIS